MDSIFSYSGFREYLRAFYLWQKSSPSGYTYAKFAKAAGIQAPNYLKLVLDGSRRLSLPQIHQFAAALKLKAAELDYFEALVLWEQSTLESERRYYARRAARLKREHPKSARYTRSQEFVRNWSRPALLVCLYGDQGGDQQEKIAQMTGLKPREIQAGLEALVQAGLAVKGEDDIFRVAESQTVFQEGGVSRQAQKDFLFQQLELSRRAFQEQYQGKGKFISHTISASAEGYPQYVEEIESLLDRLTRLSDADRAERVVQLNLQLFPLRPF